MRTLLVLTCISGLAASASTQSASWPDYRGPHHDGRGPRVDLARIVAASASPSVTVWKTPIHGRGWSSPIVVDGEVWVTTATPDGKRLSVLALDLASGAVTWDEKLFDVDKPQFAHAFNSYASPSPVAAAGKVYASFGSPGTACIDAKTKTVAWRRADLRCDHFRGAGSSPILFEDLLILTMDGADQQYLIALDTGSGKTRWKRSRSTDFNDLDAKTGKPKADGDWRKSFATPIVIRVQGKPQLISPGAKAAFAYDPRTGKEIWTVRYDNHSSASRTLFGHGLVFLNTGFSRPEILAIDPTGRGDITDTHVRWRARRRMPKKPSPVLAGDSLLLVSDGGIASCLDARTGKERWHQRIGGAYSASLARAGDQVLACAEGGELVVFGAGTPFEELARSRLPDGFMASPALLEDGLILRSRTHVYRLRVPASGAKKIEKK